MEPEHAQTYGQAFLAVGGAIALISWGVGNLFSKMTSGYGGIIKALQDQNAAQQLQLDVNHTEIATLKVSHATCLEKHEECDQHQKEQQVKIASLEETRLSDKSLMSAMQKEIEQLKEKSHVTAAMQDVSEKIDNLTDSGRFNAAPRNNDAGSGS